jgi:hypothetical protein
MTTADHDEPHTYEVNLDGTWTDITEHVEPEADTE